jgi:hypothetical protein
MIVNQLFKDNMPNSARIGGFIHLGQLQSHAPQALKTQTSLQSNTQQQEQPQQTNIASGNFFFKSNKEKIKIPKRNKNKEDPNANRYHSGATN